MLGIVSDEPGSDLDALSSSRVGLRLDFGFCLGPHSEIPLECYTQNKFYKCLVMD